MGLFEKSIFYDFTPPSSISPKYAACDKITFLNASLVDPVNGKLSSLPEFIKYDPSRRRLRVYIENTTDNQALYLK